MFELQCAVWGAADVDRCNGVGGCFRCRLRTARLGFKKTAARREKSSRWLSPSSIGRTACTLRTAWSETRHIDRLPALRRTDQQRCLWSDFSSSPSRRTAMLPAPRLQYRRANTQLHSAWIWASSPPSRMPLSRLCAPEMQIAPALSAPKFLQDSGNKMRFTSALLS